jgi:hypothetical protein
VASSMHTITETNRRLTPVVWLTTDHNPRPLAGEDGHARRGGG